MAWGDHAIPFNMLGQLLLAARAPDPDDLEAPVDDQAWVFSNSVNRWSKGWRILADNGFIDMQLVPPDGEPYQHGDEIEIGATEFAIRLTDQGVKRALDDIEHGGVKQARAEEKAVIEKVEAQERNAHVDGFGMF